MGDRGRKEFPRKLKGCFLGVLLDFFSFAPVVYFFPSIMLPPSLYTQYISVPYYSSKRVRQQQK